MVVGFAWFRSEWPDKYGGTQRRRNGSVSLDRLSVVQIRVADPVYVCCRSPGVNALCPASLMRRRSVAAICADKHRAVDFSAKIFQQPCQENDGAWHIMRKLAQQQPRFAAIHKHQFGQREMRSQAKLVRFLPAGD